MWLGILGRFVEPSQGRFLIVAGVLTGAICLVIGEFCGPAGAMLADVADGLTDANGRGESQQ